MPLGATLGRAVALTNAGTNLTTANLAVHVGPPRWHFGVVAAMSLAGGLLGAGVAPPLRRIVREEYLLVGSLGLATVGGLFGAALIGLPGQAVLALCIGVAAAAGKQAFDAVVQRDAPDANRGRSFARFESRFQVAWVLGAFLPVVLTIPTRAGGGVVMLLCGAAGVLLAVAVRAVDRGQAPPQVPAAGAAARRFWQQRVAAVGDEEGDGEPGAPDESGPPVDDDAGPSGEAVDDTEEMPPPGWAEGRLFD